MTNWQERTMLLTGKEGLSKLNNAHVLVIGLGGVGAYAAEQLCRAGIGEMTIVDGDLIETNNRNRQLPALISTEGKPKAEVLAKRFIDINPELEVNVINEYLKDDAILQLLSAHTYDYLIDAIDTLSPKVFLLLHAIQLGIPVISSMGAGGKYDPGQVMTTDISKSYNCKLARIIRKRLHKHGIRKDIKVVFSPEPVEKEKVIVEKRRNKASTVGTLSYMPPVFGCFCASVVIRDLLEN